MSPSYQPAIQSFIDHLKYRKRYSQHTIISYEADLAAFFDYLKDQYPGTALPEITATFIRSWLAEIKEHGKSGKKNSKGDSPRTVNRAISCLRSFFKYQLQQKTIGVNPVTAVVALKTNKRLPQYLEMEDTVTLFKSVEFPDNWTGKTERMVLELLYNTGMRQAELLHLKEHNIDIPNGAIKVLGKGSKERVIPISNELIRSVKGYIADKRAAIGQVDPLYLLVNEKGKKLYPKYVYRLVTKYLSAVTTMDKKSPHILRHTFATHLTNSGADLNAVKELLGHSSLAATQVYTHNSIEKLKDIHKKAHPKA
jgi:integrase/recombinase XerC